MWIYVIYLAAFQHVDKVAQYDMKKKNPKILTHIYCNLNWFVTESYLYRQYRRAFFHLDNVCLVVT